MTSEANTSKRIAFVSNALTGPELTGGNRDVSKVYDLLTDPDLGRCSVTDSPKPIHECGSRVEFETALGEILENWKISDQLIFYFSGHGDRRGSNNKYGLILGQSKRDFLPFDNILNELDSFNVKRAILILDTCYAGAATGIKNTDDIGKTIRQYEDDPDLPGGIAIIASSRANEASRELPDGSSSVFTHLFCEGIRSGRGGKATSDGFITVSEIVEYVNSKLDSNKYRAVRQHPAYSVHGANRAIWISKNKSGKLSDTPKPKVINTVETIEELKFLYETTLPDKHPCVEASIDDLDWGLVESFSKRANYLDDITNVSRDEILSESTLYSPILHSGRNFLHKSAVLCFTKRPDKFYNAAKSMFVDDDLERGFSRTEITGPLSLQVEALVNQIRKYLEPISYIAESGLRFDDFDVFREVISNAITHRNYNQTGTVTVTLTEGAVEVSNPGKFPPNTSWADFFNSDSSKSIPVNGAISYYLAYSQSFEGIGRGFNIFKQYAKVNGPDSIICKEEPGPTICIRVLRQIRRSSPVRIRQFPKTPVSSILEFENREYELGRIANPAGPRLIVVDAPPRYGKTYLLREVRRLYQEEKNEDWVCALIDLVNPDYENNHQAILNAISEQVVGKGTKSGAVPDLASNLAGQDSDVLLLFDTVDRREREAKWLALEVVPDLMKRLSPTAKRLRVVFAGRYVSRLRGWSWPGYTQIELSDLEESVVLRMIQGMTRQEPINYSVAEIIAQEVTILSGGHPETIKNILQDFASRHWAVNVDMFADRKQIFDKYVDPTVNRILNRIADDKVREALKTLSIFRRFNVNTIQALQFREISKIDRSLDPLELLSKLTNTGLIRPPISGAPYYSDAIVRKLIIVQMRMTDEKHCLALNKLAYEIYDAWITGQDIEGDPLKSNVMDETQVAFMVESFYHFLYSQKGQQPIDEIETKLSSYSPKIKSAFSDSPAAIAGLEQLLKDNLLSDKGIRRRLGKRIGEVQAKDLLNRVPSDQG